MSASYPLNMTAVEGNTSAPMDNFSMIYVVCYYVRLAVDLAGLAGNCLCVLIMLRKNMRGSPFSICALCLAISDSCFLVASAAFRTGEYWFQEMLEGTGCKFIISTFKLTEKFSSWTLVTITAERLVVVVWPLKSHLIITPKRIVGILIITAILIFGVDVHNIWTVHARRPGICFYKESFVHSLYFDIYTWIDQVLRFIIPFIIISVFNAFVQMEDVQTTAAVDGFGCQSYQARNYNYINWT